MHKVDCPTNSRVPVLAQFYHLDARKLDTDVQRTDGLDSVELSDHHLQRAQAERETRIPRPPATLCQKHQIPEYPRIFAAEEPVHTLPNFLKSMPNLRSLSLTQAGTYYWSLPIDPFDLSAHTFRDLSLDNIPLCHSIFSLRSLTVLSLTNCHFNLHLDTPLLDFWRRITRSRAQVW